MAGISEVQLQARQFACLVQALFSPEIIFIVCVSH